MAARACGCRGAGGGRGEGGHLAAVRRLHAGAQHVAAHLRSAFELQSLEIYDAPGAAPDEHHCVIKVGAEFERARVAGDVDVVLSEAAGEYLPAFCDDFLQAYDVWALGGDDVGYDAGAQGDLCAEAVSVPVEDVEVVLMGGGGGGRGGGGGGGGGGGEGTLDGAHGWERRRDGMIRWGVVIYCLEQQQWRRRQQRRQQRQQAER